VTSAESLLPVLLAAQGVMGGFDTLVNHEMIARLPQRPEARREIGLHSIRESIYGALFLGLAWFAWQGAWAFAVAALLAAEIVDTACDEYVENKTRVLPQNERVLHVLLTLNLGLITATLAVVLVQWAQLPTGVVRIDHGFLAWILTALGLASLAWSLRDFLAWRRLPSAPFLGS
jgi:hypothetical protein